ncbi:MAG TPA: toprim domain-containing protein [Candidatus Acidoferrum sp.]|nr:toprim domain-containing protein [Candidatus Acidoferrum sp.]
MPLLPRDQILEQTDVAALADELLGPRRGRGPSATWPCPSPHHGPQTGRTPPVSIFTSTHGYQRWHCHACGAGGTAIDLLLETTSLSVREALEHLAQRTGLSTERPVADIKRRQRVPSARVTAPRPAAFARQALRDHVQRCYDTLWSTAGRPMLDWLHARGLSDEILQANQVGGDPGPRHLARARGIPSRGPAVIFPVLDDYGPIYLQARYLNPDAAGGRKYENPASWVATNPRSAPVRSANVAGGDSTRLWICEGLPDALSVAQYGEQSLALLGVGLADQQLVAYIRREHLHERIVIGFDADGRGRSAAAELAGQLSKAGHRRAEEVELPQRIKDLNDWVTRDPNTLRNYLASLDHTVERDVPNRELARHIAIGR